MPDAAGSPVLTVLMTVYNGSPYLRTAIDSILQQTYSDFRFLIIDDASTDDTVEILSSYDDERIQLVCLEQNVGQTAALNIGLRKATTRWIARMDADDYSAPTRFEEQMQTLEADDSISCVGTHVWIFHDDPEVVDSVFATPVQHDAIKHRLLRGSPVVHGSIIVDRTALLDVDGYDERYRFTQDLEMYDRLVSKYKMGNVPKLLVGIRQHEDQASQSRLANDEALEICSRRLKTDNYSRKEATIIRSTLSRAHLIRARFGGRDHKYTELWKDLLQAIRISPYAFLWNFCSIFIFNRFSNSSQLALRRVLARSAPRFLTGR